MVLTSSKPRSNPFSFLRSRLSQRIVLSVFGSILAIEGLILIPSVIRRKQELLDGLALQTTSSLKVALVDVSTTDEVVFPKQLVAKLSRLDAIPMVVGGAIYNERGEEIGQFGEAPKMAFETFSQYGLNETGAGTVVSTFDAPADRYETAQVFPLIGIPYWVVINHDATFVRQEVQAFIWRIFGLVLLISAVVTLTTMIVLRSVLIMPILALSKDLLQAAPEALKASNSERQPFSSARYQHRNDELGEVISAFKQMFERISYAIAQRQKAEDQLRESENRFRTLVDQAAESMVVLNKEAKIVSVNQFALRYLGYSRDELVGNSVLEINPLFTLENYQALWRQLETGEPVTLESRHRCKSGVTFPVEIRSSLVAINGEDRMLALVRDISDRKQAEKAQARLAEIGELAAMIVHEVRNPFTTVYMALSTFQSMELPPRGQMRLALAMEESERLKRLLNEILAYSKEQTLAGEQIDIRALSQELLGQLQESPAAEERYIQLLDCEDTAMDAAMDSAIVMGDRDKLKQVFINLVTNACEAIPPAETVTWTLTLTQEQQIEIKIHNGGDPIPPDVLPKLTQPFVSTKSNGNGLGLAITKRIIEAHGGHLKIQSTPEEGTTVTAWLPLSSS